MVLIEKVAFEQLLSCRIFQVDFVLFNCFCILPFLVVYMVLVKVFGTLLGDIWCKKFVVLEGVPVEVSEPRMGLHLLISVKPNPTGSFSSQTFIDEISGFE